MDIHTQLYNTDLYKRSVINMGTKLYNKLPEYIKEIVTRPLEGIEITSSSSAFLLLSGRICNYATSLALYLI